MQQAWHKQQIIAEVRKKGSTLCAIARKNGLKKQALYTACDVLLPRHHKIIAKFLNVNLHEIWPQFYDENNERLSLEKRKKFAVLMKQGRKPILRKKPQIEAAKPQIITKEEQAQVATKAA